MYAEVCNDLNNERYDNCRERNDLIREINEFKYNSNSYGYGYVQDQGSAQLKKCLDRIGSLLIECQSIFTIRSRINLRAFLCENKTVIYFSEK